MLWRLIIKEFGPNIQHIAGVDNIVADTLSRLMSTPSGKYNTCTRKSKCRVKKLFAIGRVENNENCFPLNLLIVQREKKWNEEYKFQPQYIHFGSRIRLLHART